MLARSRLYCARDVTDYASEATLGPSVQPALPPAVRLDLAERARAAHPAAVLAERRGARHGGRRPARGTARIQVTNQLRRLLAPDATIGADQANELVQGQIVKIYLAGQGTDGE